MEKNSLLKNVDAFIEKNENIYGGKSYQELKDEKQEEEFMRKLNLTPRQKAAQLITIFESITHPNIHCDKQFAKECARRTVNEININVLNGIDLASTWGNYWEQVKQEIDKL
jgi:membrane-associated HD superfamily phosphohydrolase